MSRLQMENWAIATFCFSDFRSVPEFDIHTLVTKLLMPPETEEKYQSNSQKQNKNRNSIVLGEKTAQAIHQA